MSKFTRGQGARRVKTLPLILMLAALAAASPSQARTPAFHWEKIHLKYARPSQIFASLGLDHTVRYGHTRGDGKPGSDPNFPAGMTDIVPYDADKTIIVRGTLDACARFRQTALAADVAPVRWRIDAELLRVRHGQDESVGRQTLDSVTFGSLQTLTFLVEGQPRAYQLRLRGGVNGSIAVVYQYSMQLPTPPLAPDPGAAPAASAVFVPAFVYSRPLTEIARAGEARSFDDLAAERQVQSPNASSDAPNGVQVLGDDYRLMLTIAVPNASALETAAPDSPIFTPER